MARRPSTSSIKRRRDRRATRLSPTDIALSAATVAENAALGAVVGAITGTDPAGQTLTFTLTDDASGKFAISGTNLIVSGVLDFETHPTESVTIRATDPDLNTYSETFTITVTNVAETAATNPPPTDGTPVDDGTFTNAPVVTSVNGGIKLSGKKAAGSAGKFIYDIGVPLAGRIYTMTYDPDFTLLANTGKNAFVGFGFKSGNNFHLAGLKGDGSTGLDAHKIYGANFSTGASTTDTNVSVADNGTQAGPNWLQIETAADGSTYTLRTSSNGTTWVDEITAAVPTPLATATGAGSFGIAVYLEGTDAGSFSVAITLWTSVVSAVATSYANTGGTGARTPYVYVSYNASNTFVSANDGSFLVDGSFADVHSFTGSQTAAWLKFQFAQAKVVNGIKWYQSASGAQGTWKMQGSNDDSTYTDLGSSFTLNGTTTGTEFLFTNNTAYKFYKLAQTGGTTTSSPSLREIEFKIESGLASHASLVSTSYGNTGGTGARSGVITATNSASLFASGSMANLIDGSQANVAFFNGARTDGVMTFDFATAKTIDAFKWYHDSTSHQGYWKLQGSSNGSSWTDVSGMFQLTGTAAGTEYTNFNTTAYRYYRLLQVAGTTNAGPYTREIEFKIST